MSKMKRCVVCRTEILKVLKRCPHCNARQPNLILRYSIFALFVVVMILGVIGLNYFGNIF
jgi:hypothetical protein